VGLLYLRARYYSPEAGRFVSRDLFPGESRRPETWHKYTYAANQPTLLTDPTGMDEDPGQGCYYYGMPLHIRLNIPPYSQLDSAWADDDLGTCRVDCTCRDEEKVNNICPGCDESNQEQAKIRHSGCLLTSASMVFAYYGSSKDPGDVNDCMGNAACEWDWEKGAKDCSEGKAYWIQYNLPGRHGLLIWALTNDYPVIVKTTSLTTGDEHWIVVYEVNGMGLSDSDYWALDPAGKVGRKLNRYRTPWYNPKIYFPSGKIPIPPLPALP